MVAGLQVDAVLQSQAAMRARYQMEVMVNAGEGRYVEPGALFGVKLRCAQRYLCKP